MNRIKRICALLLAIVLTLGAAIQPGVGGVFAADVAQIGEYLTLLFETENEASITSVDEENYIYFDLAAGNVNIGKTTYRGSVYVNGTATSITGAHADTNRYYIYQSDPLADESSLTHPNNTGYKTQTECDNHTNCSVPKYDRVKNGNTPWTKYITNNKDVYAVSNAWAGAAQNSDRTSTENYITFSQEAGYTADVTIDNIWSIYHQASTSRNSGGIGAHLDNVKGTTISLRLKGDNRVGCVHYSSDRGSGNKLIFSNGDDSSNPGSITVADFPGRFAANHWNAVIGAADNPGNSADMSEGIVIDSGVIYAGATWEDNCTAIGGGGNQYGSVTINNGTVTAVTAGTGTAIGGGIGYGEPGGETDVTIEGGTIYAYNLGINPSTDKDLGGFVNFVPAAAIGGGGSRKAAGGLKVNITIKGGTIYAQSMGGPGIGGGGSAENKGGPAKIDITGGTIIAKSVGGMYGTDKIDPGVSIGGGTGLTAGGSVELNISGENTILRAGSIGGGSATGKDESGKPYKIGNAKVTVSDGDIIGQVIMAGGADDPCSFTMTGGVIHSTDVINGVTIGNENITGVTVTDPCADVPLSFKRQDGGAVFMDDPQGVAVITGGVIENCTANNGGAVYMSGGKFTLSGTGQLGTNHAIKSGGSVYLGGGTVQIGGGVTADGRVLVAEGSVEASKCAICNSAADMNGGGVYVGDGTVDMRGGSIRDNTANKNGGGMFVGNGNITLSGKMSPKAEIVEEDGKKYFTISTTSIKRNKATNNGGGMFVDKGKITIKSGEINYNESVNGAGMFVGNGTVTMSNGSIHDNTATNSGGGMFVSGTADSVTNDKVTINGGSVKFNKATNNGGGMFVDKGNITINYKDGSSDNTNPIIRTEISNNTATKDGGGVFVTGDVYMLDGSVTKNSAVNGGGFCVEDGTVLMYGGSIDGNSATENGGGMHVTANNDALVDIFSGSISNNTAKNGGGVSVLSTSAKPINVTVGVNCEHPDLNPTVDVKNRDFTAFPYKHENGSLRDFGKAHNGHTHYHLGEEVKMHSSCPQIIANIAEESGGGFYLKSSQSNLTFYCVTEQGNKATKNSRCDNMDVEGGHVVIGDGTYKHTGTDPVKGNIIMQSSILVNAGTVDIYGTMVNPDFTDDVTVDITGKNDHYIDHRLTNQAEIEYYKVHYYENFKGDGDTPTGLYIARQYPDLGHNNYDGNEKFDFTIMPSIFSHPGYKIVGWDKESNGLGDDFKVNETYNLKKLDNAGKIGATITSGDGTEFRDKSLLVIYAIWERCGYVLKFDPNVGEGETYTGTMENQRVTVGLLDGTQKINKNMFQRHGYRFIGWTLTPAPTDTDTVYADGHSIEKDFTDEDGATVTLYAQWERCTHVEYLIYTADKNVLTQSCSACGGHTATATVSAVNAVYDSDTHLATANFSTNWLGDKPAISYEMAASEWDGKDEFDEAWINETDPKPLHAGSYTAKLTAKNEIKGEGIEEIAAAQAEYTISRVKWATPAVPVVSFSVQKSEGTNEHKSIINITEPIGNNVMYKITHLPKDGTETGVDGYPDWQSAKEFANIPYGMYYYFYAKVSEDRDHMESDPSKSAAYLTTGGNIVYIENGEGIKVVPQYGEGNFKYTVSADNGYHLRGYQDNLPNGSDNIVIGSDNKSEFDFVKPIPGVNDVNAILRDDAIIISKVGPTDGAYTYTVTLVDSKVMYHQITLKFSGAAKNAAVASKVTDGQVFSDFNNKETSISRDSAFTAQFTVSDYIPEEYTAQALRFSKALPAGATVIMKVGNGYWYYKSSSSSESVIDLTRFTEMGGDNKFILDTAGTDSKTFTYQFIVDFSKATDNYSITDKLDVSLELTANKAHSAPDIPTAENTPHISLDIQNKAVFKLDLAESNVGKSATLNCSYTPSAGVASIWNGRKTALVLTAESGNVPADLTLTAVVDGNTTLYTMNSNRQFIIPLDGVGSTATTKEIKVTLNSCLFGSSENYLTFTADWYVSQSSAGKSPLNGYKTASCDVLFSCKKDTVPSVRIDGNQRILHAGEKLSVTVEYKDIDIASGKTITAYLQGKKDAQYVDTGASFHITPDAGMNKLLEFNMGQMSEGSYRILVIVQEAGANILQVPYYFVIA